MQNRIASSRDGVAISYAASRAETALVFIHGLLGDRTFWDAQHGAFAERFRVIAVDLAGHGDSGRNRARWGIPEFGCDVAAAVDAEGVKDAILVGNSLGGPVAIEAALLLGGRAKCVIGVDTFHDLGRRIPAEWAEERADAWRTNFDGTLDEMVRALFHPDAPEELITDVRQRMSNTPAETVADIFRSFGGYDIGAAAQRLRVPLRCINGDLWPTNIEANRKIFEDFDAVVLPHTGHFPMLECPEVFNGTLAEVLSGAVL
jgi:pimeloyl-ACP methyl ester carboxylesterase